MSTSLTLCLIHTTGLIDCDWNKSQKFLFVFFVITLSLTSIHECMQTFEFPIFVFPLYSTSAPGY